MIFAQNDFKEFKRHERYYERLGPSPENVLLPRDFYRFETVKRQLRGNSVLDVGCARADFLNLIKSTHQIAGIEITKSRAALCNKLLGADVVMAADLEESIDLEDNSYDTIVCMEVLKHLTAPLKTLRELSRVSAKRIILTVPFDEQIQYLLCVHCATYTPYSGHLHSFNMNNIQDIVPPDTEITHIKLICNSILSRLPALIFKLPYNIIQTVDQSLNSIFPRAKWMLVNLDKIPL